MRPNNFPHAKDFIGKLRARKNSVRQQKIDSQLSMIAKRLESFDEDCDLMDDDCMENDCIKISADDMGSGGIHPDNLKVIGENGWVVHFDEAVGQYVFRIKGHFARKEEV